MARLDDMARTAAASGRMAGPEAGGDPSADLAALMGGGDPAAMESGGEEGGDVEGALMALEAALETLPADAAEQARAHIEALRSIVTGVPSEAEELPELEAGSAPASPANADTSNPLKEA